MAILDHFHHLSFLNICLTLFLTGCFVLYRKFFPKQKIKFVILLLIIGLLPTLSIFRDGTYRSGDMNTHTIQLIDFYQNLKEGTFVPQWSGDLCGGYGCPVFLIEYILPYYIASFFTFIGFSFLLSTKLTLVLSFVLSGITMYLWAKDEFGKKAGFLAAVFYLYAPYHLIDFHFRGSTGEIISFIFIPLLFLFQKKLIESGKIHYFFLQAVTILLILLSHASTTLIALPLVLGYGVVTWIRKDKKQLKDLLISVFSIIYGVLLSSFYFLPALDGIKYTWLSNITFGDFKPITEYLFSPVLYGLLFQGNEGEYRLVVGYFHMTAIVLGIFFLMKNIVSKSLRLLLIYLLICFFILFFMMLEPSKFIWQSISLLHSFMVVWRLLVPIAFISAAIVGIVAKEITNIKIICIACFLLIFSTIPNWSQRAMVPFSTQPFLHEPEYYTEYYEIGNPIFEDNWRKTTPHVREIIAHPPKQPINFLIGKGEFVQLQRTQIAHEYVVNAETNVVIRENTNYFPGWKVYANNKEVTVNYKDKKNLGKVTFELKKGLYNVQVKYTKTPIVQLSELLSFVAILAGIVYILWSSYESRKKS
jgi:uncharacterized membrane protein